MMMDAKTILGTEPARGRRGDEGRRKVLEMLATHPKTAEHVSIETGASLCG